MQREKKRSSSPAVDHYLVSKFPSFVLRFSPSSPSFLPSLPPSSRRSVCIFGFRRPQKGRKGRERKSRDGSDREMALVERRCFRFWFLKLCFHFALLILLWWDSLAVSRRSLGHGSSQRRRRSFAEGAERGGAWTGRWGFLWAWSGAHEVAGASGWSVAVGGSGAASAAAAAADQPHAGHGGDRRGAGHHRHQAGPIQEERGTEGGRDGVSAVCTQKHVARSALQAGDG